MLKVGQNTNEVMYATADISNQ